MAQPHFFISYKRNESEQFAEQIETMLRNLGFEYWRDVNNLRFGEKWSPAIDEAINNSVAVLLIVTPNSIKSQWVTYEWSFAMGKGVPVIPLEFLKVDDNDLHGHIAPILYANLTANNPVVWEKLAKEIEQLALSHGAIRVQRLLSVAKNPLRSEEDRCEAINGLGYAQDDDIVDDLLELLKNNRNSSLSIYLISALGTLGNHDAVHDLILIAEEDSVTDTHLAIEALQEMGAVEIAPNLVKLLSSRNYITQRAAAAALGAFHYFPALQDMLPLLAHPQSHVREYDAEAIGHLKSDAAVESLVKLLDDREVRVRAKAAIALGEIGSPLATDALGKCLSDYNVWRRNRRVCDEARDALRQLRSDEAHDIASLWDSEQPMRRE